MAYRSTANSVTGVSPSLLFLGRDVNAVPVVDSHAPFLPSLREYADILDSVEIKKSPPPPKESWLKVQPGDKVLIRRHVRNKLQPGFESDWEVVQQIEKVVQVKKNGRTKSVNIDDIVFQNRE